MIEGLTGTLASAAVIALVLGLVLLLGRLSRSRLLRRPPSRESNSCAACRPCCSSTGPADGEIAVWRKLITPLKIEAD